MLWFIVERFAVIDVDYWNLHHLQRRTEYRNKPALVPGSFNGILPISLYLNLYRSQHPERIGTVATAGRGGSQGSVGCVKYHFKQIFLLGRRVSSGKLGLRWLLGWGTYTKQAIVEVEFYFLIIVLIFNSINKMCYWITRTVFNTSRRPNFDIHKLYLYQVGQKYSPDFGFFLWNVLYV